MMRQMRDATKPIMIAVAFAFIGLMVFTWGMDITGQSSGGLGEIGRVNRDAVTYDAYMAAYQRARSGGRPESCDRPGASIAVLCNESRAPAFIRHATMVARPFAEMIPALRPVLLVAPARLGRRIAVEARSHGMPERFAHLSYHFGREPVAAHVRDLALEVMEANHPLKRFVAKRWESVRAQLDGTSGGVLLYQTGEKPRKREF